MLLDLYLDVEVEVWSRCQWWSKINILIWFLRGGGEEDEEFGEEGVEPGGMGTRSDQHQSQLQYITSA